MDLYDDPDKPGLPYLLGFTASIHRHYIAGTEPRSRLSEENLQSLSHSKLVVTCPAIEPSPPTTSEAEIAHLMITAPIAIGAFRGPQVVACTVTSSQTSRPFRAAAKIYDPLYYEFRADIDDDGQDCVCDADEDYRTEAAAYEHLVKSGQSGAFAPEYYGSWAFTFSITIDGVLQTRNVRLILIELLDGTSIKATRTQNHPETSMRTDSFHYPEQYRMEVLARAMDGYVKQIRAGLVHGDFKARHVMLIPYIDTCSQGEKICGLTMPRIVLIDYRVSRISDSSPDQGELPVNPAEELRNGLLWHDFFGWVPDTWQDREVHQDWLLQRFYGDDHRHVYHPTSEFFSEWVNKRCGIAATTPTRATTGGIGEGSLSMSGQRSPSRDNTATRSISDASRTGQPPRRSNEAPSIRSNASSRAESPSDDLTVQIGFGPGMFVDFKEKQAMIQRDLAKIKLSARLTDLREKL